MSWLPITNEAIIIGLGVLGIASFALVLGRLFVCYDRALFGPLNEAEARQRSAYDYGEEDDAG